MISIQVFNSCFMKKIKDLCIEIDFHIWPPIKTLSWTAISSDSLVKLNTYYSHYKEIPRIRKYVSFFWSFSQLSSLFVDLLDYNGKFASYSLHHKKNLGIPEFAYNLSLLQPPPKLLSPSIFSDSVRKFAIYNLYYKQKLGITNSVYDLYLFYSNKLVKNLTRTLIYITNYLYFGYYLYSLGNVLTVSLFSCDDATYATEPGLVTKKRKLPRTVLDHS